MFAVLQFPPSIFLISFPLSMFLIFSSMLIKWHVFLRGEHGVVILGFFCSFALLISVQRIKFRMDFFLRNAIVGFYVVFNMLMTFFSKYFG